MSRSSTLEATQVHHHALSHTGLQFFSTKTCLLRSDLIMSQRDRRAHFIVPLMIFPRRYLLKTGTSSLTPSPVSRSHLLMQHEANQGEATGQKPQKEVTGDNTGTGAF